MFSTPGNGCTHNVQLEIMLQDIGLTTSRRGGTVDHQPKINPSNTMIMFEQGAIDATAAPEPWGTYLVEELGAKVIAEWESSLFRRNSFLVLLLLQQVNF
ncbi:hypothetical protein KHA80_04795 [Anaerobacillus sp. HL2]|nr:hypothetical protein KHA80_04795 [Anaerobacillus sp. HL2]